MNGLIALLGSGEYLPVMDEVDRYILAHCGANERTPRVICLPTAAGQEGEASYGRWMRMGEEHFKRLGADVTALAIIDAASANDPQYDALLESADLIYFSGGNPKYLYQTMHGSRAWATAQKAWARGAAYAGCSAGAMILSERIPDMSLMGPKTQPAFGIAPATYILPHFDAIPGIWKPVVNALTKRLKENESMLGIDEETALIGTIGGTWAVYGRQTVSRFTREGKHVYKAGEEVVIQ
ncbi:MAG: Peptidase E [Anaerolineales bacterium]|nr:Peptidase E [Anaerolineales bacterium]